MPVLYVGLDDTDMLDDAGTGQLARAVARRVSARMAGCELLGVSRHQLLLDSRVPCTRRNRCSCVAFLADVRLCQDLTDLAREVIIEGAVPGSDPGLCVAEVGRVGDGILAFGELAKKALVTQEEAIRRAADAGIRLEPLGGTGDGIIGALAAVGLRHRGNDGWLTLWRGLRELHGPMSVQELRCEGIDAVVDTSGRDLAASEVIETDGRLRPSLKHGRKVLVVIREPGALWQPRKITE